MKVVFVHTHDRRWADTQTFGIHFMPVWAYTLAAHLSDLPDVELALFDARVARRRDAPAADVYLFTGINQDYDAVVALHRRLRARRPAARFVVGGPIAWSFRAAGRLDALAMFDHVVVGDGEEVVGPLVADLAAGRPVPHVVEAPARFDLARARPMHRGLLAATADRYYGAVVEVGRGCPFLCEFCDVRTLPDNNRARVKAPALVVEELDALHDLGVRRVLLACDNLIGDLRWAEDLCDAVVAWRERTGKRLGFYTWLTINVARHPALLRKLRLAGFDMLFIGVESFSRSSLLETAKVQNTAVELGAALRAIQAYGFIVVAGLIFGFDTDPDDAAAATLRGLLESGLVSGDPSLLTALPGTPLHTRMALAGRLRDVRFGLGGHKYRTNIRYLKPAAAVRAEFQAFVRGFVAGRYQYARLVRFYDGLESPTYVPPRPAGRPDLRRLLVLAVRHRRALATLAARLARLGGSAERTWWILRALWTTWRRTTPARPLGFYLAFWLFNWSSAIVKYAHLSDDDFDVESVAPDFAVARVLPAAYEAARDDGIPVRKVRAQRRVTATALRAFIEAQGA